MSTIDNYGIQYGTGELFPKESPGGTDDPNNVTQRRNRGANQTVGSTATASGSDGQDLLNAIQMGNLGTGQGVYSRRESNTFYFKSLEVENGLTIRSTSDSIIIGGPETMELPRLDIYLGTEAEFDAANFNKFLKVKADGTGIEYVDGPTGGGALVTMDTESIQLTGEGTQAVPLSAVPIISTDLGNTLEVRPTGLYAGGAGGSNITFTATESINIGYVGQTSEVKADIIPSAMAGNALTVLADGVYVAPGNPGPEGPEGPAGPAGPAGADGADGTSLQFAGAAPTVNDLPDPLTTPEGQAWMVDSNVYILTNGVWVDGGEIQGPEGPQGPIGPIGPAGPAGADGQDGQDGADGDGFTIIGPLADVSLLPTPANSNPGESYWIGTNLWTFIEASNSYVDMGDFVGPEGPQGPIGATGPQGNPGAQGIQGTPGVSVTNAEIVNNDLIISLSQGGPINAGTVGGADNLVELLDVDIAPASGDNGKAVIWNEITSKFVLGSASGGGSTTFTALTDTPANYTGANNRFLKVNSTGTGVTFATATFTELADTPAALTGQGGKFVAVNAGATALEFVDAPSGGGGSASVTTWILQLTSAANFTGAANNIQLPAGWTYVSNTQTTMTVQTPVGTGRPKVVTIWGEDSDDVMTASLGPSGQRISYQSSNPNILTFTLSAQLAQGNVASGPRNITIDMIF